MTNSALSIGLKIMLSMELNETQTEDKTYKTCGGDSVDVVRVSKTKLQMSCGVVQVKRTKTGKLEFFADTIPVFLMCGSEDALIAKETAKDEELVIVLTNETGKILSILADFLHPGNYLINKPPVSWDRLTEVFKKSHPESRLSLRATTWSPYLSSVTDPMKGQHLIMINYATEGLSHIKLGGENPDLAEVVRRFELSQIDGDMENCLGTRSQNCKNSLCDNLYYCMIMSSIKSLELQAEPRKRNFQMRIKYVDAAALKEKKKRDKKKCKNPETDVSLNGPMTSVPGETPFLEEISPIYS